MAPILISYRCRARTVGASGYGASDWAAIGAVIVGAVIVGGEDLTRGLKDELWPPRVLAIGDEDWGRWGRPCR